MLSKREKMQNLCSGVNYWRVSVVAIFSTDCDDGHILVDRTRKSKNTFFSLVKWRDP